MGKGCTNIGKNSHHNKIHSHSVEPFFWQDNSKVYCPQIGAIPKKMESDKVRK